MKEQKQKRNLVLGLVAAAVLVAGITGGAIWAQDGDSQEADNQQDATGQSMASRVAEILGLDDEEVQAAFQQASREIQDERFQNRMDRLVEMGQITEDEAVDAVAWYQSRPGDIGAGHRRSSLKGLGQHRLGSRFGFRGMGGMGQFAPNGS